MYWIAKKDYDVVMITETKTSMKKRFRGFLPVVIDIETAGFHAKTDAVLEIAAVMLDINDANQLVPKETHFYHVEPFKSAHIDPKALEFNKIDPFHPFRFAESEKATLEALFTAVRAEMKLHGCGRAVLVGHNPNFDLGFLQAATTRAEATTKDPFHQFTTFDTATLAGVALGQTVLIKACEAAKIPFDVKEAHSAKYDAERTAELFCYIVNRFHNATHPAVYTHHT